MVVIMIGGSDQAGFVNESSGYFFVALRVEIVEGRSS